MRNDGPMTTDSPALPPRDGDAPLQELGRDRLSVFLYTAFTSPELKDLVKELGLSIPGYRVEKLSDVERADLLADEIRAVPAARKPVIALMRKIYEFPALDAVSLGDSVAAEIAITAVEEDAMVRLLWRVLADPSKPVRVTADKALDALVALFYGKPGEKPPARDVPKGRPAKEAGDAGADAMAKELARVRKDLEAATAEVARAKEHREELKGEVKAFRTQLAKLEKEAADARTAAAKTARKLEQTEEALRAAKEKTGKRELDRLKKESAEALERAGVLEQREKKSAEERDALRREVEELRRRAGAAPVAAAASAAANDEDAAPDEDAGAWAVPRFTREFYDSISGWDPRAQRLAFEKAVMLAINHRHPSLRAIPLEGLPGYFRVRIASDIRMIYRRAERDREVEILSLIDREDLDRYVRQAKTR